MQAVQQVGAVRSGHHQALRVGSPGAHAAERQGQQTAPRVAGQGGGFDAQFDRRRFHVNQRIKTQQRAITAGRGFHQRLPVLPDQARLHLLAWRGAQSNLHWLAGRHAQGVGGAQAAAVQPQPVLRPGCDGRWRGAFDVQHTFQRLPGAGHGFDADAVGAQGQRHAVAHEDAGGVDGDGLAPHAHGAARCRAAQHVDEVARGAGARVGGCQQVEREGLGPGRGRGRKREQEDGARTPQCTPGGIGVGHGRHGIGAQHVPNPLPTRPVGAGPSPASGRRQLNSPRSRTV